MHPLPLFMPIAELIVNSLRSCLQLFTSDGIPIEPFHLRRERAEGFFDGEGNYVEYRLDAVSDAWLDSLGVSVASYCRQ